MELARHMAEVTPTRLVTFGPDDEETSIGRLEVRVIGHPWYVRGQRTNPFKLELLPQLLEADVIHCHQQHVLASSFSAIIGRLGSRRVFVSDLGGGGWDISSYISTDRWYHGHLHISEYSRQVFGHAANPRAHVILGGVDTTKFSPPVNGWATSIPPAKRDALYVGRILPHKGVDYLVEAATQTLGVTVIGRPYHQTYMDDLRRLVADRQVTFLHEADDGAIIRAYQQSLCVVLPSVYQTRYGDRTNVPELLGQTLLEGMACGVPAICTNVASMPEIVEDGISGFIVPPNDPCALRERIQWLRDHPAERNAMGRAARQRVLSHFTWPAVVERCLRIYAASSM